MLKINPMDQAIQQIYNDQITVTVSSIKDCQLQKNNFLNKFFKYSIDTNFTHLSESAHEFQNQIYELLNVINCQFQLLNKMKKDEIKTIQTKQLKQGNSIFSTVIKKLSETKSTMMELCQFSSKMFAIVSLQLNQMKSVYSQNSNIKERRIHDEKKLKTSEQTLLQQICQSQKKNFQLERLQKLIQIFQKQYEFYLKCLQTSRTLIKNDLQKKKTIYRNCLDNLQRYQEFYVSVFNNKLTHEIQQHFLKRIQHIDQTIKQIAVNQEQNVGIQAQVQKQQKMYIHAVKQVINQLLERITQTKYQIIYQNLSSSHKSSNNIPQSQQLINLQSKKQQKLKHHLILTLTKKMLIISSRTQNGYIQRKVQKELQLSDCKIGQPDKDGHIIIKTKKKQKIMIQFASAEREGEFFLHVEVNINKN